MNILLVATNQADRFMDRMVVRPIPIGLVYLAEAVDEDQHSLKLLDLMFSDDPVVNVRRAVESFEPDVVGLSIRNLDNMSSLNPVWHLPGVRDVVDCVRDSSDATTVCGGPGFSILPNQCLEFVGADVGVMGDGVEPFRQLIERLDKDEDYREVSGLCFRDGTQSPERTNGFAPDFQKRPRLDLLDMRRYNGSGFGVGVVTKLARAYYPSAGDDDSFSGTDWRLRGPDDVVDEIRGIDEEYGIRKVFFIDSGFNIPIEHAKKICRAIIDSDLSVRWNSYIRPGDFDEELAGLMKESGCSLALIAEGPSQNGVHLSSRLARIGRLAELCRRVGLPYTMSMTFGEPGESEAGVGEKLDFLSDADPAFLTLRVGTRVLPGTHAFEVARDEGLISSELDLIRPTFYVAPDVRGWLAGRLEQEASTHPRWNLM